MVSGPVKEVAGGDVSNEGMTRNLWDTGAQFSTLMVSECCVRAATCGTSLFQIYIHTDVMELWTFFGELKPCLGI